MKTSEEIRLRALIRRTLREEFDAGSSYSTSVEMGGLGGGPYYEKGSLAKIFIKPFTDVIGVAAGKAKEMASRSVTLVRVAFETVMTTLIPFLTDSYNEIFSEQEKDLDRIRGEYASYYRASDEALRGPLAPFAFMAFPGPALAGKLVEDGPDAVKKILSVATGGLSDKYLGQSRKSPGSVFDSYARTYSNLLREAEKSDKGKEKKEETLADKIAKKKFIEKMLGSSPTMKAASKEVREILKKTLREANEQATEVLQAKSIEDLQKAVGKPLKGVEELKKLDPKERKQAEEEFLKTAKKSLKKFYTLRLEKDIEPIAEMFGEDFPLVKIYNNVIQNIKSL